MKITFDKELYPFIKKALRSSFKKWECSLCKGKLNKKNFGGVIAKKLICNNIVCLVKIVEEMEKNEK